MLAMAMIGSGCCAMIRRPPEYRLNLRRAHHVQRPRHPVMLALEVEWPDLAVARMGAGRAHQSRDAPLSINAMHKIHTAIAPNDANLHA
jgi:hypothetical protein